MHRILPISFAALVGGIGLAYYVTGNDGNVPGISIAEAQTAAAEDSGEVVLAPDFFLGEESAPIEVIEYGSFTCPHCANFYQTAFGDLKENYIDTGKVKFIHREVYFDRYGLWGGMVARCGGEMRYYGIVDKLYETQDEWIGSGAADEILENLRAIGRSAGMNNDELDACMNDQDLATSMVAAYQTHAEADEINATPTFIINGEKYSNMAYSRFAAVLDEKLAEIEE